VHLHYRLVHIFPPPYTPHVKRYLKGKANRHDWDLAAKVAERIANGEDPVRLIAGVLSKARTHGQVEALRLLGQPTSHLFDEVEEEVDQRDSF
jgi:hypothetical protein